MNRLRENKETLLFATSTALILLGGVAWLLKAETPADVLWTCLLYTSPSPRD